MKNLLLSALCLISFAAFSQADVAARMVNPADGGSFSAGVQFNFEARLINSGTVDITANDTILYAPVINGQFINSGGAPLIYFSTGTAVTAGDSISFSQPLNLSGGSSGNLNFCVIVDVIGPNWNGVVESDTTNNLDCNSVTYNATVSSPEFTLVEFVDDSYFSNGVYHVQMKDAVISEAPVFRVYNITGQEVYSTMLNANGDNINEEVRLNSLNRGVYIVQVLSGSRALSTRKIVVN